MPVFEIEHSGKKFQVDAPDESTALSALNLSQPSTGQDIAKSFAAGSVEGVGNTLGLPSTLADLQNSMLDKYVWNPAKNLARRAVGSPEVDYSNWQTPQSKFSGNSINTAINEGILGGKGSNLYEPQTTAGQYAKTIGEFAPAALFPAGNAGLIGRTTANVVAPAVVSEAAGQATEGTAYEPAARIAGALLGGFGGSKLASIGNAPASALKEAGVQNTKGADKILRAMTDEGLDTLDAYKAASTRVGEQGMLADMGNNLFSQADVLANTSGAQSKTIREALMQRSQSLPTRISQSLDDALGEGGTFAQAQAQKSLRKDTIAPLYDSVKGVQANIDVAPIVAQIDEALVNATGKTKTALQDFRSQFINADKTLKTNPEALVNVRQEIARSIRNENRDISGAVSPYMKELDSLIEGVAPKYKSANAQYKASMDIDNALTEGQSVFSKSTRPEQLQAELAAMPEEVRQAYLVGARDKIAELMGTARNDAAAVINEMSKKGWNAEKLRILVGDDVATKLLDDLGAAAREQATTSKIFGGSPTDPRLAARKELLPPSAEERLASVNSDTLYGDLKRIPMKMAGKAIDPFIANSYAKQNADMAKILTATGSERDQIVEALLKYKAAQGNTPKFSKTAPLYTPSLIGTTRDSNR